MQYCFDLSFRSVIKIIDFHVSFHTFLSSKIECNKNKNARIQSAKDFYDFGTIAPVWLKITLSISYEGGSLEKTKQQLNMSDL